MSEPVYRFYRAKLTDAWHQLSQEEKDHLQAKLSKAFEKQGIDKLGPYRTFWSSGWSAFGLEVPPDVQAVEQWRTTMEKLGAFKYVEIESMLEVSK